jgi:acetylglutamate kinase
MIPKIQSSLRAVRGGVREVWIAQVGDDYTALKGTHIHA